MAKSRKRHRVVGSFVFHLGGFEIELDDFEVVAIVDKNVSLLDRIEEMALPRSVIRVSTERFGTSVSESWDSERCCRRKVSFILFQLP